MRLCRSILLKHRSERRPSKAGIRGVSLAVWMLYGNDENFKPMIRSHIIPNFYLKQFVFKKPNGKDYVYLYEKGQKPTPRWTRKAGCEMGYFGYVLPDGTVEESLEARLADMEKDCSDELVSAKSDLFVFTERTRRKLAFYAALLHSRTTQRLEFNKKNWLEIYQQLDEAMKEDDFASELTQYFSLKVGKTLSRDWIRKHLKGLIQEYATAEQAKNVFLEELINNANMTADQLLAKRSRIWKAPKGTQFVTSDNPLATFIVVPNGEFAPGFGFGRNDTVAAFPVCPNKCLLFGGDDPNEHLDVDVDKVWKINEVLISSSHHFVYANKDDSSIQRMAQQLIGTRIFGVTAFVPSGPLPTVKDFIRGVLGIPSKPTTA